MKAKGGTVMTIKEIKKRIVGKTIRYVESHNYLASIPDKIFNIKVSKLEFKKNFVWIWTPLGGSVTRLCTLRRDAIENLAERGESIHEDVMWTDEFRLIENTEE